MVKRTEWEGHDAHFTMLMNFMRRIGEQNFLLFSPQNLDVRIHRDDFSYHAFIADGIPSEERNPFPLFSAIARSLP